MYDNAHNRHRIIWSSKFTGSEETAFVGSLADAQQAAQRMIGERLFDDNDIEIGRIDTAYVADENGNPL